MDVRKGLRNPSCSPVFISGSCSELLSGNLFLLGLMSLFRKISALLTWSAWTLLIAIYYKKEEAQTSFHRPRYPMTTNRRVYHILHPKELQEPNIQEFHKKYLQALHLWWLWPYQNRSKIHFRNHPSKHFPIWGHGKWNLLSVNDPKPMRFEKCRIWPAFMKTFLRLINVGKVIHPLKLNQKVLMNCIMK